MRVIFRPAELVLGRLKLAQRFFVLAMVLIVPFGIVVWAYAKQQAASVASTTTESHGSDAIAALLSLEQAIVAARHAAVTSGRAVAVPAAAIAAVDRTQRRYASLLGTASAWAEVRQQVVLAGATSGHATSLASYEGASIGVLDLLSSAGDASLLSVDPDLDVSALFDSVDGQLPRVLDTASQIVDQLSADASDGFGGSDRVTLLSEIGIAVGVIDNGTTALDALTATATRASADPRVLSELPGLQAELDSSVSRLDETLRNIHVTRSSVAAARAAVTPVLAAVEHVTSAETAALGRALDARIDRVTTRAHEVELLGASTVLLAIYLFGGFYYLFAGVVRRMVATLRAFARGEPTEDIVTRGRDELGYVAAAINDMVRRVRAATAQLTHDASHDGLTGLPNRARVIELLERSLPRVGPASSLSLLFVDLDGFKPVNDFYGHATGDALLRAVAARLIGTTRSSDMVARLSGDEFLIVSSGLADVDAVVEMGERMLAAVSAPINIDPLAGERREIHVGASIGVAFVTEPSTGAEALIADADAAMYRAKERGRGRVEVFDDSLRAEVLDHQRVREELLRAIAGDEIRVHYQPIVNIETRHVYGFEALVRWEHPERGLLHPGDFMAAAERTGLIVPLGALVLREACRQLALWRLDSAFGPGLRMSVNLSTRQLVDRDIVGVVKAAVAESGIDPGHLWLEVTESALLIDADAARSALLELREAGVRFALDDFGTGYSSLQYLKLFPLDAIKIDRGFVAGIGSDIGDEAIVRSVTELGRSLGLEVVAEGVETERQREWLLELGQGFAQGYLFSRPRAPEAFGGIADVEALADRS